MLLTKPEDKEGAAGRDTPEQSLQPLLSVKLCLKIWPLLMVIHKVKNFVSSYKPIRRERRVNLQ